MINHSPGLFVCLFTHNRNIKIHFLNAILQKVQNILDYNNRPPHLLQYFLPTYRGFGQTQLSNNLLHKFLQMNAILVYPGKIN